MATHARGLICAPMLAERLAELGIAPMVANNTDPHGTAFHVGVDFGRAPHRHLGRRPRRDARRAGRPRRPRRRLRASRPHLPAGRATRRGAASRRAHRGGRRPCAAGGPAAGRRHLRDRRPTTAAWPALPELLAFADEHGLLIVAIADLIALPPPSREAGRARHRGAHPHCATATSLLSRYETCSTAASTSRSCSATSPGEEDVLVRVHSECLTGDVFGSLRCDCGAQLRARAGT